MLVIEYSECNSAKYIYIYIVHECNITKNDWLFPENNGPSLHLVKPVSLFISSAEYEVLPIRLGQLGIGFDGLFSFHAGWADLTDPTILCLKP